MMVNDNPGKNIQTQNGTDSAQSLVDRLQYEEFFSLFPAATRNELLSKAIYKAYKPGDLVYCRGDRDLFMGVVMSGRLRMSMTAEDGRGVLIGLVERGEVFGETPLLDGLPRTTDAEADTETTLMILKRDDFVPALRANPDAMLNVIKMLCHRLRIYLDTIDLIALQNLPKRLARHLLRLAGDYGVAEDGYIVIRSGLNQSSIGQQLATSRESINKQLKEFSERGFISLKNGDIVLLDRTGLDNLAGY
ncbi:MAG: Crp/Fnr family transcriptional regulator [Bdellovibrionales bacterium]